MSATTDSAAPAAAHARLRVLVVDDDAMIRDVITRVLNAELYEIVPVESAEDALALLDAGDDFDVVLSDMSMPSMTGMEFYQRLQAFRPRLAARVVFLSGGATSQQLDAFLASIPNPVLGKPFSIRELSATIDAVALKT